MAQFVPIHIQPALDILVTEREQTAAERDAFGAFHDRIEILEASQVHSAGARARQRDTPLGLKPSPNTQLQRTREAYRETVMSVPHYAEEYDQSLVENLAVEFDPAVARAMTTSDAFTPPLRERLLTESHQARADCAAFLRVIEQEADALRTADERLAGVADLDVLTARSLDSWSSEALAEAREAVAGAEQHRNEMASERQTTAQRSRTWSTAYRDSAPRVSLSVALGHSPSAG